MSMERGLYLALKEGTMSVSYLLLQWYARLGLSETDMMLLVHIQAFKEKELKDFPTIEELQSRMSAKPERVIQSIQKLLNEGWITIDEDIDPETGIQYERYNIDSLYERLADVYGDYVKHSGGMGGREAAASYRGAGAEVAAAGSTPVAAPAPQLEANLFSIFEKEFGRPLSPMECETISGWLDKDKYSEALVVAALKESVFAGKVHFRYIDRILLEWARNRVRTPEEAKEYAVRYRGGNG